MQSANHLAHNLTNSREYFSQPVLLQINLPKISAYNAAQIHKTFKAFHCSHIKKYANSPFSGFQIYIFVNKLFETVFFMFFG